MVEPRCSFEHMLSALTQLKSHRFTLIVSLPLPLMALSRRPSLMHRGPDRSGVDSLDASAPLARFTAFARFFVLPSPLWSTGST